MLIITATDFSAVANNAVNYACDAATAYKASVVVLHSFMLPVMFSDIPMPPSLLQDAQQDAEKQINTLLDQLTAMYPGILITGKVVYGDTISVLEEYKESGDTPWLIVIGNSSTEENTWSEHTVDQFKTLKYPVLAVPPGITFKPLSKICFASDNNDTGYAAAIKELTGMASLMNATLHILHITTDADTHQPLQAAVPGTSPAYHTINDAGGTDDAILDFIEKNDIDWLAMMPRKHSFFEGMFHKSHTKAIAQRSHIPVLALHENHKQQ